MLNHKMTIGTLFFLIFSLSCLAKANIDYKHTLNGQWSFKTDLYNQGLTDDWFKTDVDVGDWDRMAVPGNWDLENEYADYVGKAWYRKTITVPDAWRNKAIRLVFESVYNDAQVWLNGQHIGEHHIGFLPFSFNIEDHLKYGESNTLVLQVDNTFKRGAVWNWGGIRRPVWLEVTDKVRLERQHITAIPDLEEGTAAITINFEVSNVGENSQKFSYDLVVSREGKVVWSSPKSRKVNVIKVASNGTVQEKVSFHLPKSKVDLWHFNSPNLYTSRLRIYRNDQVIHQIEDRFGIRKVEVDGYAFKLNGESIRTVGFNLVPEDRVTGNTLPLWRIKEDVDLMKSLGANMTRLSHLPLPEAFLDYLDEKGIMIFEEVSLWGKDVMVDPEHPLPKYWLEKMIDVKYHHPSIIGWSIGNEIGYIHKNPKVMAYVKGAVEHAKQLDPNRLAIYVSNSAANQEKDPVKYSELIMFNAYGKWGDKVGRTNKNHPGKPIFLSEYGNNLNDEDPNMAHIEAAEILAQLRGRPYVMGASLWTFNDYRSFWQASEAWSTPPSQNRAWGIVDTFRQKKRPFAIFKQEYAPVRSLDITLQEGGDDAEITLVPRRPLDIPAYIMRDYMLVWHLDDATGKILDGGILRLPEIRPGDPEWRQTIHWKNSADSSTLKLELLDPQAYSVLDKTVYFTPPVAPKIITVHTSMDSARVVFDKVSNALEYKLVYSRGRHSAVMESSPSINNFIEVGGLERFTDYHFTVVALNDAGESRPSRIVEASTDEDELPPVIWDTVAFDDRFFIGYSVDRKDYMYEIRYGTVSGGYTRTIGLRNVGVVQIPGLEPGKTYYYQMRSRKQWGFASEWTHEIEVDLYSESDSRDVELLGVIREDESTLLYFNPVEKAVAYKAFYREKGTSDWYTKTVSKAVAHYIPIVGLDPKKHYEYRLLSRIK